MKIIRIKTSALLLAVFGVFAVCATAQADTYPVAFSASAGGSVSSAGGQYNSGETVTCTATPAAGYRFVKWSGDVDEFHHHAPTLSVTVGTNALSYSASFAPMEEGEVALAYRGMCFPNNYMKNTVLFGYARNIWDMIEFDGKIYYTYGNASNFGPGYSGNSGAVTFGLIDPLTDALSLDYTTGEDQVRSFRIGDNGKLYAPGLDACGQGSTTYLYTRAKGGDWTRRMAGGNTHMCDAIEWNGYEVAANRFSTGGAFNSPSPNSGNGDMAYLPLSSHLYYAAESMCRFVPNGASSFWKTTQMKQNGKADKYDLYPGFAYHKSNPYRVEWPCLGIKPYRPIRYGDSVLYGAAVRHNDHQHLPVNTSLFMASENTQAASSSDPELVVRTVQIGALTNMASYINTMAVGTTRTRTWDFLVKEQGGRKIVVALIEQQTDRNCTTPTLMFVYASEGDLSEWREIFRFRTPEGTFARSFEYANGKFYFGLGSEADCGEENKYLPKCSSNEKGASIYTGEIYSYAYDLFAASEAPPSALPTAAFASAAQTVQENAGTVSISVVLSQASSSAVSIPFTLGGTALAGTDYQIPASPLTIPAGQTSGTIDIVLAADGLAEPAETISVVLGTPTGATLGTTTTHTLTIAASEATPPSALPAGVYLKALGVNEERTTVDGTSWATAYTDAKVALDAALASEDRTLYVAAGVYPLSSTTAVGDKTLKIYGGFAGVDGETLEQRNTQANQSIFTGDKDGDDCYIHYELSTNATPSSVTPSVTITTMEGAPVVKDGRFNPPAYTGEYDIYAAAVNGGTGNNLFDDNYSSQLFTFSNGATFVLDGIYLIGYRNTLVSASGANTSVTINDCRFYANRNSGVSVENLKSFTLSNSHFAYGVAEANGGLWCASPGLVTNCQFESIYNTGTLRGGIIHINTGRTPIVIADSTFHRIARHGKSELAHGGPAVCIGAETGSSQPLIRDCDFTFCWSLMTGSATGCAPIVGTVGGSWYIEDSRFEHNFISCSVKSGYSYFLVGQHATAGRVGGAYFRNTVFADNVIAAHADEGKGNYALGIAGSDCYTQNNYTDAGKHVFVNCLFDRNFAEDRTGRSGVAPVLAEGILASANTFGTICGAANCTFISATSANPSVALVGSNHYWPVNVVNCLFLSDAAIANPFYSPVVPTDKIGLRAYSCTAQNCFTVPQNVVADEGWQTDWVPLVEEKDSFPVVKVLTPGLRESADLAVTDYYVQGKNVQYRFKPYGSDAWQLLHTHSSAVVTTAPEALVADAVGNSRPVGGVTRGCVQALTEQGELGKAVILRREPFGGGDLGGAPSAQNVGALEQSKVTATPIEGAGFQGWYNEAGDQVASTQEIDLSSFANGAILTAKFSTKEVTVTFDLGQGGRFVENDSSTKSYPLREGDVFPKLPPYVESDEWLVEGWDESPAFVPSEDLTINAKVLTKASRVFHIVPPGAVPAGSDGSGTSWANATDDIAAAAADAARYRGELWFKEGTYQLSAPIYMYSNVAFIGGFKGDETERNQADPTNHVTLLTGDLNGENYWLPQGADPGAGNRTLVFDDATRTLNVPQPATDVQTPVWRVKYTSNAANAFSDSLTIGCATNTLISGMTIACFSESAIKVLNFDKSQTLVENCRFVGNSWNANDAGVVCVKGSLQMRHCDFRYNHGGVDFKNANDTRLSVVDDCTFYCNEICKSRVFRYKSSNVPLTTSNCRFEDNVYTANNVTSSIEFSGLGCTISNWVVRNTRTCLHPILGTSHQANGHIALDGNHTFVRCRFEDNLLDYSELSLGLSGQSAVLYQSGGSVLCRDCFFARNTVKSKNSTNWDRPVVTSVAALHNGSMAFINCTLMDNFADAMESTSAAAATVGHRNEYSNSGLAFVHCTLANNTAQGGKAAADLLTHPDSESRNTTYHGIGILNSILHNSKDPSYKPLKLHAKMPPTILYSALSNINKEDFDTTLTGTLWKDVTDNTSGIAVKASVSPDGVKALGIKSISPLTHGTDTIVLFNNRPYLWNAENAEGVDWKTYISLVEPNLTKKPDQVGLPSTDKSQPAPLPDAFGVPRIIGKLAVGALNAVSGGLTIRFR